MPGLRKLAAFCIGVTLFATDFRVGQGAVIQVPIPVEEEAGKAYELGMRLVREKRYQEALEQFKRVERDSPRLPQGYTGEGIALCLDGKAGREHTSTQESVGY
jgi:hypothetical protein